MNILPQISIVVPVYNTVKYIQETVECLLNQTYQNIEIIIQDDCSTDGTWEVLQKLYSAEKKVSLYQNERNLGIGPNWNAAYEKATGAYVVIFNGDDWVPTEMISTLYEELEDKNVDFSSCNFVYRVQNNENDIFRLEKLTKKQPDGLITNLTERLLTGYPFSHVFTLHKKTSLDSVLLSNGNLFVDHQICDFELWIRLGLNNRLGYHTNTVIGHYRKHESNNSAITNAEFSGNYVVFSHHEQLKNQLPVVYKNWIKTDFINHIKTSIKKCRLPHVKATFNLVKYYFK